MPADPFTTLGLDPAFDLDLAAVEQRYRDLSRVVHPDRFAGKGPAERRHALGRAVDLNDAWRKIRDPISRAEALLRAHGIEVSETSLPRPGQALLIEFLDLREQLAEARASRDLDAARRLADQVKGRESLALDQLRQGFARLAQAPAHERPGLGVALLSQLAELRYIRRFFDEVRAIEEEVN